MPMLFVKDGKYIGIIAVADTIKEDSYKGVNELKNMDKVYRIGGRKGGYWDIKN